MVRTFAADGITFEYPADWTLDREESADGWAVTLQSPGVAFAVVRLDRSLLAPNEVAAAALEALRGDYPALEASSALDTIAGEMAVGHDVEFFSLDMLNTCWTRCFYGLAGTVLILCQASDADAEDYEPALRHVSTSMRMDD